MLRDRASQGRGVSDYPVVIAAYGSIQLLAAFGLYLVPA